MYKGKILIKKLNTLSPEYDEYHIYCDRGPLNLIRMIIRYVRNTHNNGHTYVTSLPPEFFADDFFTDHSASLNDSCYLYSRVLASDEPLYKEYESILLKLAERKAEQTLKQNPQSQAGNA